MSTAQGEGATGSCGASDEGLTVGATAQAIGVSVRTLHHWDATGLVTPSARTWAGYRLYSSADIERLQRVLVYRELGMSLEAISELLEDDDVDAHLLRQRELLSARISRLAEMVSAVDRMRRAHSMNEQLTPQEQARAFGSEWDDRYAQEAQSRWGDTEEWKQSEQVKQSMSDADWAEAKADTEALESALADAFRRGVRPGSEEAEALARQHFESIGRWFDMTLEKQVLIARGYVEDPRFAAYYDKLGEGLAVWLKEIIDANAVAHGVDVRNPQWW